VPFLFKERAQIPEPIVEASCAFSLGMPLVAIGDKDVLLDLGARKTQVNLLHGRNDRAQGLEVLVVPSSKGPQFRPAWSGTSGHAAVLFRCLDDADVAALGFDNATVSTP